MQLLGIADKKERDDGRLRILAPRVVTCVDAYADRALPGRRRELDRVVGRVADDVLDEPAAAQGLERDRLLARGIRNPDIAFLIDEEAMGPNEHAGAEAFDDIALRVESKDRIDVLDFIVGGQAIDLACVTRAMASMLSGGTGSSSHIGWTCSSSRPSRITSCVS